MHIPNQANGVHHGASEMILISRGQSYFLKEEADRLGVEGEQGQGCLALQLSGNLAQAQLCIPV